MITVLNKTDATIVRKIKNKAIEWYVPHYTPSVPQQAMLSKQFLSKVPTELQHIETSVFMKEVKIQNLWTSELGTQEAINVPIWTIVGFQQKDRQGSQNLNSDTFYRPPVTSAQCTVLTGKSS